MKSISLCSLFALLPFFAACGSQAPAEQHAQSASPIAAPTGCQGPPIYVPPPSEEMGGRTTPMSSIIAGDDCSPPPPPATNAAPACSDVMNTVSNGPCTDLLTAGGTWKANRTFGADGPSEYCTFAWQGKSAPDTTAFTAALALRDTKARAYPTCACPGGICQPGQGPAVVATSLDSGVAINCARCTKGLIDGWLIYVQLPPERVTDQAVHLWVVEHQFWIEGPPNAAAFSVPVSRPNPTTSWKTLPLPAGEVTLSPVQLSSSGDGETE